MARLRRGFEVLHEEAEEQADDRIGQTGAIGTEARRKAANPHRARRGKVRDGDRATLEQFAEQNNLQT